MSAEAKICFRLQLRKYFLLQKWLLLLRSLFFVYILGSTLTCLINQQLMSICPSALLMQVKINIFSTFVRWNTLWGNLHEVYAVYLWSLTLGKSKAAAWDPTFWVLVCLIPDKVSRAVTDLLFEDKTLWVTISHCGAAGNHKFILLIAFKSGR